MAYTRLNSKPIDMRIALMHWEGYTDIEIAQSLGCSTQKIASVLASANVQQLFAELRDGILDTMLDVRTMAQAIAPRVMEEKISLALDSPDPRVRSVNCKDLLEMAGHRPPDRVQIEKIDRVSEAYVGKTEEEIRAEILRALVPPTETEEPTLH